MSPDSDEAPAGRHRGYDAGSRPPPRRAGRRSWLAGLAVLALVAVAGTAWALTSSSGHDKSLAVSQPEPPAPQAKDGGATSDGSPPTSDTSATSDPAATSATSATSEPAPAPTPARVGHAAPSQVHAERPLAVTLASDTTMRIRVSATATTGDLAIPANINQAGWWDGGSKLGDPYGAIVVAAHVDSFSQGIGRFAELLSMHPGDVIRLDSADLGQSYRVVSAKLVPKASISSTSALFSASGQPRLVLITCGGQFDPSLGGYQSNVIVIAEPTGQVAARN